MTHPPEVEAERCHILRCSRPGGWGGFCRKHWLELSPMERLNIHMMTRAWAKVEEE